MCVFLGFEENYTEDKVSAKETGGCSGKDALEVEEQRGGHKKI